MSYRLKLILTICLLIAMTFSIGGTILISVSFHYALEAEMTKAMDSYESLRQTLFLIHSLGDQTGTEDLGNALEQMEQQRAVRWQAISLTGDDTVIYTSSPDALRGHQILVPPASQCTYSRISDTLGQGLLILSTMKAGESRLVLTARFDLSPVYAARDTQMHLFSAVYTAVMVLGAGAAVILSFPLTGRLRRLTTAVRRISGGDLSTRSRIQTGDEFGQLSRDFDAMADKLQENIARLQSDIERKESFMGSFAHELKTPMTSIIGFADLLRQGNLDENTRMMAAEYIYTEGHRLERLSFKLLELLLLKKDNLVMKRVWLGNFVTEIDRAMAPRLREKGIRLVCRAEQKQVVLEPDLVKSLLYNLIDNASKAIDGDGIIAVKGTAIPGGCQFQVADNGRGIPPEELTKITEAFYRVDKARSRSQGGAGLGLALCKQIVELHGGSIHFASEPGKATQVTVTLYGKAGKKHA